jgi:cellulase/cellobiase CelA1
MTGYAMEQSDCVTAGVTFGVTWGQRGFASESYSARAFSEAQRMVTVATPTDGPHHVDWFRGKFVEIIFSQAEPATAKSLKKMVGATGIEPVTPTMSR